MHIVITGSTGFLGKETTLALKKNYKLTFIGKKKIKKKNYIFCNLNNSKKLKLVLEKLKPDVVINLAAEVNFTKKTKNMYKVNTLCPYLIAKFCKKNNAHFIHASGTIINGMKSVYNIKTKYEPVNAYGKSKLDAEILIRKINCKYSIIRFGGIYGKNGPQHLGINKFIKDALNGKNINFTGNIQSMRNYIFVKDAAKFIQNCVRFKFLGVFYAGGEKQSFKQMLLKIKSVLGQNILLNFKNNDKPRQDQIITNNKKFMLTSFKKSLLKMV
tara:strand:+ start:4402 stop:5214 length:813 start_codon:yes stop_codon:yes gene_type:complete